MIIIYILFTIYFMYLTFNAGKLSQRIKTHKLIVAISKGLTEQTEYISPFKPEEGDTDEDIQNKIKSNLETTIMLAEIKGAMQVMSKVMELE